MKFSDIVGQEAIKDRLRRSVHENRVSHAQLFMGPEGSGKLSMALAYAQYINCLNRNNGDSCGVCTSCLKYEKLIHPDLHFILPVAKTKEIEDKPLSRLFMNEWRSIVLERKAVFNVQDWFQVLGLENKQGIINTDDCVEIIHTLSYKSYESEYKVMIIWMAERIYHSAAPRILKILEEPPDKTLFLLIAEESDQILPTILSRTQLVKFPRRSDHDLVYGLINHTGCTAEEAARARFIADGNLNAAVKMVESGETGQANFEWFRQWMRLCFRKDIREIVKMGAEFLTLGRERQKNLLSYAMKTFHHCIQQSAGIQDQVRAEADELKFVGDFSKFVHSANAHQLYKAFNQAFYHIERNGYAPAIFLDLSLTTIGLLKVAPPK